MVSFRFDKINEYLKLKNYSINDFCKLADIPKREMKMILSGKLEFKVILLLKLAKFFDVPIDWLFSSDFDEIDRVYL